jgi:hypothetical protein
MVCQSHPSIRLAYQLMNLAHTVYHRPIFVRTNSPLGIDETFITPATTLVFLHSESTPLVKTII